MATPTISEYTAHLRQDKTTMREYMRIAGVDTKESDTFTNLTEKVLNVAGAQRQVYVQPDEPQAKEGIWLQTEQLTDFDVVSDPAPFINEIFSSDTKSGYNPDASNSGSKVARYYVVNNVPYYLVFDQSSATRPNNSYRFYRYNKEDNSYTLLQSYSASEIIAAREQVSNSSYNLAITHGAVCIDDNQEYLYLVGGGNSTKVTDDPTRKYVVRFGLKTHSISRVFTFAKPFFVIGGTYAWLCNCVICGTKIFVFGYNDTNSGAYGPTANTKIIDLAAGDGTEYSKSNGPISYGGTVLKFNNELIVGFGGGNGSHNSGQGMNNVRLFSTLTETTRTICDLTNKINQRAICAVGSLIYFAENTKATGNFGCINLEDYTVRYINKGTKPSHSDISSSMPYYDKDLNCIMFGSFVGTKYPFILTTKDYTRDTVVIFQASYETAAYKTNVFTTNNFKSDVKLGFSNAWLYKTGVGIDKTIKRYYGTGTEWKEITEANAFGGIIDAPVLQNKAIEITENSVTNIVADTPYDGLESVKVTVNIEGKEDLTEELANYNTSLTEQETSIQDIVDALQGKATGGGLEIIDAKVYSTEEQVVGKWIDNKPLYRKTFVQPFTVASGAVTITAITHGISNIENIWVGNESYYLDASGNSYAMNYCDVTSASSGKRIRTVASSSAVSISISAGIFSDGDGNANITLYYTKRTDTATTEDLGTVNYSLEEREVGTDVDGSIIYEKTISTTPSYSPNGGNKTTNISYDVEDATNVRIVDGFWYGQGTSGTGRAFYPLNFINSLSDLNRQFSKAAIINKAIQFVAGDWITTGSRLQLYAKIRYNKKVVEV